MARKHFNRLPPSWIREASVLRTPVHLRSRLTSCKRSRESRMESKTPENDVISRAKARRKTTQAPSTEAGEFVREEIEHIRRGVPGTRSAKMAFVTGLSRGLRYVSSILLAAVLFSSVVFSGCAVRASCRIYDPSYQDYHVWDGNEVVFALGAHEGFRTRRIPNAEVAGGRNHGELNKAVSQLLNASTTCLNSHTPCSS
jgi:hypothetical protein